MTNDSFATFGATVWNKLDAQPLGGLAKCELELTLLRAAVDRGLFEPHA